LLIFIVINLKKLSVSGKEYFWSKPKSCPKCGSSKIWWHGYTTRYFDGYNTCFWIRRVICPDCGSVHSFRPASHYPRKQASTITILTALIIKIVSGKFSNKEISRQRQQYWYKGFIKKINRFKNCKDILKALFTLLVNEIDPVSNCSEYFEKNIGSNIPYLSFAVTENIGFP
jgi:predicted RNA-binding Zn-ribbon protein involved in translation (DUF1610 family)